MSQKRIKVFIILVAAILFTVAVIYMIFFTSSDSRLDNITISSGMIKININEDIVPVENTNNQGIQACTFAKRGCLEYIDILPGTDEYEKLDEHGKYCVTQGCAVWGIPKKERMTIELSNEQATSFLNDYKPNFLLLNNIKIKSENNTAYVQGLSLSPNFPGIIKLTLEILESKDVRIIEGSLGRLPMTRNMKKYLETKINTSLDMEWYSSRLIGIQFLDNKIILDMTIALEIIKEITK